MKITLTCIWLPGDDPAIAKPLIALRTDRQLVRTLWPDELERFQERYNPEWREVSVMGWEPAPSVYSAEIDLETPAVCRSCGDTLPMDLLHDNLLCPTCFLHSDQAVLTANCESYTGLCASCNETVPFDLLSPRSLCPRCEETPFELRDRTQYDE